MPVRTIPVILSGGSGTRLWPLSRTQRPKQLLPLTHRETMLQLTVRRVQRDELFAAPMVVANAAHAGAIEAQLSALGTAEPLLMLEPCARNTAPAIALAALAANSEEVLLVMPSDHVIQKVEAFQAALVPAIQAALDGWIVTLGIAPTAPETGYGYIRRGEPLMPGLYRVDRFVEKPDRTSAQAYLDEGGYSWNGGIFVFRAGTYLTELEKYAPAVLAAARQAVERGRREGGRFYPDADAFGRAPSISIDYAVMERAERVAVVPVDIGWSDVGSWDALHELAEKDGCGNAHHGEVVAIDTANCLLRSEGPLVAAVGVKDVIVVATRDAVLVLPRGDSQQVKRAIERLEREGHVTLHEIW